MHINEHFFNKPNFYTVILALITLTILIRQSYFKGMWKGLLEEAGKRKKEILLILFNTIIIVFFIDKFVSTYFTYYKFGVLDFITFFGNFFGNGKFLYQLLVVTVISLSLFHIKKANIIFKISLTSTIFAGIINLIPKFLISRERPFVSLNPTHLFNYPLAIANHGLFTFPYMSMPSGHTIVTFSAIIPLILHSKSKGFKGFLMFIGLLVAFSRVYATMHFTSDVFLGAMFGTLIGKVCYEINKYRFDEIK